MSDKAIVVTDLYKRYDLGGINSGTVRDDLKIWWSQMRGQADPTQIIGEERSAKEYWALKGVDFEIKKGESVGIIGKNGAGKSTLLKILSRVTSPTKGTIGINGRIASLLEVGTGFHPDLTGRENIYMNGSILGMRHYEINRKLDEIIEFTGVEKYIDTPVKRYSSGMYVRLAFAVAAHLEPEILIVDEVLAVGDAEFQNKCLGKMGEVTKEGRTVLFVSHSMSSVQKLCTRGIILNKGALLADGEISKVINDYMGIYASSQTQFDFDCPKNVLDIEAYSLSLQVEDKLGNKLTEVPVGTKWQIRLKFQTNKSISHFIAAIGILTSDETPFRNCWSDPTEVQKGVYEAIFKETEVIMATGTYKIVVGLSTYERNIQFIDNAATLIISDVDFSNNKKILRTTNALILNPAEVTIQKIND